MHARLHVLVVLQCVVFGHLGQYSSVLVFFFLPSSPFIIISNGIVVLISPLNLVQCDGCLGWGWVWRVGLVAELWVGKAFVVFLLPGLGVGSCSSQVPKKPTSMCNSGINKSLSKLEKNHWRVHCLKVLVIKVAQLDFLGVMPQLSFLWIIIICFFFKL